MAVIAFASELLISIEYNGALRLPGAGQHHQRNCSNACNANQDQEKPAHNTLDGCCDHTKQIPDEEIHEYHTRLVQDADLLVFGRKTYQLMVPFWPEVAKTQSETKALNEFARAFDSTNKVVFSRSLDSAEDKNTRIVRANLRDEILKLKQE